MSPLRRRMIDDMQIRNLTPNTQRVYVAQVVRFACHFRKSPELLGPTEIRMVPNINPNPRGREQPKRGRKPIFGPAIFKERFRTIERVFAWEDKFRRLLLRFERISGLHYAFKTLAHTMINLWH
jgi:hypothetical protein